MKTQTTKEIISAAREIVTDFNEFGEVLQQDDEGWYSENSAIGRLSKAIQDYDK